MTSAAQRTVSRNDPCPCGSGKRFKDCHGSLRGAGAARPVPLARRSRYRPAGDDWAALDADDQDRLGALMELALDHQKRGRVRDAERLYRAVLEEVPRTHDALHMLGVVRLGLGDLADAERLIRDAMALRPSYAAIETNWSLVRRTIAARDRHGVEIVCEHALPLLCESIAPARSLRAQAAPYGSGASEPLHIVGPGPDEGGDAGWVTRRLAHLLAPLAPTLWQTTAAVEPQRWQRLNRPLIDAATGRRPRSGSIVLAGVESDTDAWLRDPIERVLVFMHAAAPSVYLERLRRVAADGARPLTLVFESHAKARRFGRDQHVVPPPIDLDEYADVTPRERADPGSARVATVGQDGMRVTLASDVGLLKAIAERAGALLLLDPGPLRYDVGKSPAIHCVARGDRAPARFLADADIYFHRSRPWWTEDQGRMLFGAMALGLPVVCDRASIFAEYIDDGVDGWLYDDEADALAAIGTLCGDARARVAAGSAARAKAQRLFEPRALTAAYVGVVRRFMEAA